MGDKRCLMERLRRVPARRAAAFAAAILLAVVLIAGMIPGTAGQSGVGVAPSTLRVDDPPLVRGGSMERTLTFQQHDHAVAEVEIRVLPPSDTDARDASSWTVVDPSGIVEVPRTSDYPVQVQIDVPENAANGEYRAKVEFRVLQACDSAGSCAAVQTAASATLVLQVGGEQVKRLKVTGSPTVRDAEAGGALQLSVPMENIGNVVADPAVRLQVQDKHQKEILATHWFNETELRPGEARTPTFILDPVELDEDQYWAIVTVYLDGKEVQKSNPQTFDVLEPGSLARSAVLQTIRIAGDLTRAEVGDLVKLSAVVENTGKAPLLAEFKGEIWIDGRLRGTFSSEGRDIPIGEAAELEIIHGLEEPGRYEFKGRAHYGSKVTEEKSLLLEVTGSGLDGEVVLLGAAGLVGLAGAGFVVTRVVAGRKRHGAQGAASSRRRAGPGKPSSKQGRPPQQPRPASPRSGGGRPAGPTGGRTQGATPPQRRTGPPPDGVQRKSGPRDGAQRTSGPPRRGGASGPAERPAAGPSRPPGPGGPPVRRRPQGPDRR